MEDLTKELAQLSQLAEMAFIKASSPLAEYARREGELRQAIAVLTPSSTYFNSHDISDADKETARRGGAGLAWDRWASHRKSQLNMELARVLAEKAMLENHARRAFGRSEVTKQLLANAQKR